MIRKIIGGIFMIWGGGIVVRAIIIESSREEPRSGITSYEAGQLFGVAFGLLMFGVGAYHLFKKDIRF